MNLLKSQDYFNPINVKHRCHIIGCGSVGSTVAELLVRLGLSKITLYDFDTVSSHNLANQLFVNEDIGKPKTEALKKLLVSIDNPQNLASQPPKTVPNPRKNRTKKRVQAKKNSE